MRVLLFILEKTKKCECGKNVYKSLVFYMKGYEELSMFTVK
jgi:hypothetical protein